MDWTGEQNRESTEPVVTPALNLLFYQIDRKELLY